MSLFNSQILIPWLSLEFCSHDRVLKINPTDFFSSFRWTWLHHVWLHPGCLFQQLAPTTLRECLWTQSKVRQQLLYKCFLLRGEQQIRKSGTRVSWKHERVRIIYESSSEGKIAFILNWNICSGPKYKKNLTINWEKINRNPAYITSLKYLERK